MRKYLTAVLAALLMAVFGTALTASATGDDHTGWAGEIDLSGPADCQLPDTETVTITATNPEDDGKIWFTLVGHDDDEQIFYLGEQKLAGGKSKDYDVPYAPGAVYTIGNAGTHPDPGTVTLPGLCTEVEPDEPTVTDPTCEIPGELVIPEVEGVAYYADVLGELEWNVGATPRDGYFFPGEQLREWSLAADPALDCVTPLPPAAIDRTCDAPGFIEIPDVAGVNYAVDGDPYEAGTFAFAPGTYTVTAELDEGSTLDPADAETSWTLTVHPEVEACVGDPGDDGKDGEDGEDGKDGRDGKDGKDGKEKPDGDPEDNGKGDGDELPDTGFSPLLALLGTGLTAGGAGLMRLRRTTL